MAVLEGERLIEDVWLSVGAEEAVPADRAVIVGYARLLAEPMLADDRSAPLGVVLPPDADIDKLQPFLSRLGLIALDFPKYREGRGFSQARGLREHLHYTGEIRAQGHLVPDQYAYLLRCGVTSVVLPERHLDIEIWRRALHTITIAYQPGLTHEDPISAFRRRLG